MKVMIQNPNLGGLADSKYLGVENSLYRMVGLDLHSEPGLIKVNQKLVKESGATVDEFVKVMLPCSDGSTYLFSSTSGKIWKRTNAGVYSLEATNTNGAMFGAIEDQGYIYYFSNTKIGRWELGTAWATRTDSWATFDNGDSEFHPAEKVNLTVYIGDGYKVAQICDGVFTAEALDLKEGLRIKSLGKFGNDLLIGTYVNDNVNSNEVFRWNTYSVSFTTHDTIPQVGVNSFIPTDNFTLVSAGTKGGLYLYQNNQLDLFKRIPGDWEGTNKAVVHPDAGANKEGLPLFGLSNDNGNPALQGVYSFGNYSRNYSPILNLEYVISQNLLASIEIGAIAVIGDDVIVAWEEGVNFGVDKIDTANKYTGAYLESRIIAVDRTSKHKHGMIKVAYSDLPASTDIEIFVDKNHSGSYGTKLDTINDTDRKMIYTKFDVGEASAIQVKVMPKVSGNNAPKIELVEINV